MMTHPTVVIADHHKSVFVCAVFNPATGELRHETLDLPRFCGQSGYAAIVAAACW